MTPLQKGRLVIACMIVTVILLLIFGCNPARKIEKAEQLVITTPKSFEKIGGMYLHLYRQPIDTTPKYIKGDPIPFPVPTVDSFAMYLAVRELKDSMTEACKTAIDNAYRLGVEHTYKELKKNYVGRVDTFFKPDIKCATILKAVDDSLNRANSRLDKTEAALRSAVATGQQYRQDAKTNNWYTIAACFLLGITNGVWLYLFFKRKSIGK